MWIFTDFSQFQKVFWISKSFEFSLPENKITYNKEVDQIVILLPTYLSSGSALEDNFNYLVDNGFMLFIDLM